MQRLFEIFPFELNVRRNSINKLKLYFTFFFFFFRRCTVRSACQQASQSLPRWLSFGAGQQCIDFEQVLPDRIPINQMTTVSI